MQVRFVRLVWENDARTIGTVYFKPDKPFYYTAGQYTDLTIPHSPVDTRGQTRTMTVSSLPGNAHIAITTRFDSKQVTTYKQALLALQPSSVAMISDAMGDMVLPLDETVPLIFVAGGLGIASYVSMVRWLTARKDTRHIKLLYAVRNTDDIIFQKDFDAYASFGVLQKQLFTTDSKVDASVWNGNVKKARLTAADIVAAMPPDSQVYISGSQTMVEQLREELERTFNVPQYRIVFDYFSGYIDC